MYHHVKHARTIAKLLDSQFGFLGIRFGLDNIVGLLPGLGDVVGLAFSGYLVWIGFQAKLPQKYLNQMIANVVLDFVIGTVPLIGDIGDLFFKANLRNLKILEENVVEEAITTTR